MSIDLLNHIIQGLFETIYMTSISGIIGSILGIIVGLFLATSDKNGLFPAPIISALIGFIINILRSIPFIILVIAMIPITRYIIGTSIGTKAAIIPLSIVVISFIARLIEGSIREVSNDLIEMGIAMGASPLQIVFKILIAESKTSIVRNVTTSFIGLINYSFLAGTIGGGGLGDLAIRYGYQRFMPEVTFFVILTIIALVQIIQIIGKSVEKQINRHH
ncbi:methionine ABC transporter permease [Candidatus Liberibacter americanus]|uniref:Methionine ABC transporter permease protein n=1 Tax=Candidatus Liberibacter americanus str. Sao Paulo TaxID=1261131 RepID=U6B7B5_9HYPH|nr:methionine ABC transporter permease [Candidatus Liberibacter americanus]AHA27736.1 Methionine ABC transporter permease protein [Candidatus Liberibacter americanus str. Sao Paulo]EMS36442.1 binding-protein-dependent transport systems inner membrane component [Candidatus Liberibacter americanus PW_SP]